MRPNHFSNVRKTISTAFVATLLLTAAASAQPTFTESFSPATIGPGSVSTLRFDIGNGTAVPVLDLAFTDNLPAGLTIATPSSAVSTCGGTLVAAEGTTSIDLSAGSVGGNSTCSIIVNITASTAGSHTNLTGDLTSGAGNSGTATAALTVATDRPGFTKAFVPSSVFFGGRSTLTFTINNTANVAGAFSLAFVDNLPPGLVVASPANASTTCLDAVVTATVGSSSISYITQVTSVTPPVASGASCTVSVDVLAQSIGTLNNTAGELSSASTLFGVARSSGKATAALFVSFEQIRLTKQFTSDPVSPGGSVNLAFTVSNRSRESAATNIAFTDDLDAALSGLVATSLPANPCGAGSSLTGTSVLSLTAGTLAGEESCTFTVLLDVPAGAAAGDYTNTTSQVTGDINGDNFVGGTASDTLTVQTGIVLTKEFTNDPVGSGDAVVLEFTLTNTDAVATATAIAFSDTFTEELPTASALPASGFCGVAATALFTPLSNFSLPNLAVSGASLGPGASCTFSLTLDIAPGAAGGAYLNTTSSVTSSLGTSAGASDTLAIVSSPNLRKEFLDDPAAPGGTVTLQFKIEYEESAFGDATDITFTDDLEAALSGLVAVGLPANDVCGTGSSLTGTSNLSFTGGSLSPGETCTFSVTLQIPAAAPAGEHINTTSHVMATVGGLATEDLPASDGLLINGLVLTKEFLNDPVRPGDPVTLRFTVGNFDPTLDATDIIFVDSLSNVLSGLVATNLPQNDVCGTGSTVTGASGNSVVIFTGGSLLANGSSCFFDVELQVPAGAASDVYHNLTSSFSATIDGGTVLLPNAFDELSVSADLLILTKEFLSSPVPPGGLVTLRFNINDTTLLGAVSDIVFTDDLDAALPGLVSISGTLNDVCGTGSAISGTNLLSLTGGNLTAGGDCTFDVLLQVPTGVPLGTIAHNVTSDVTGLSDGFTASGDPAKAQFEVNGATFTKTFDGSANPGGSVSLTFSLANTSGESLDDLSFFDNLDAALSGLAATGLPQTDVCGAGSVVSGTSTIDFSGGSLLPAGSCSFAVNVAVPAGAALGSYLNVTSDLREGGTTVAPATEATLDVVAVLDTDGDGVLDADDVCANTVIPEGVPTQGLGVNRFALVDGDFTFDTVSPPGGGGGPGKVFTTTDTAGCSCEQIIAALGLGNGHTKKGCSGGAMDDWVELVGSTAIIEISGRRPTVRVSH